MDEAGVSLKDLLSSPNMNVNKLYPYDPTYFSAKFFDEHVVTHYEKGETFLNAMQHFFSNFLEIDPQVQLIKSLQRHKKFNELQIILALGFDPNLELKSNGDTALHLCLQHKSHWLLLKYLITAGADITKKIKMESPL